MKKLYLIMLFLSSVTVGQLSAMETGKNEPIQFSEESSKKLALVLDEVKKASWRPTTQEKLAALVEQAKTLLLEGANPDTKGRQGVPMLLYAVWDSHIPAFNEIAKMLIEHGANVNIKDANHLTPLMWAAQLSQPDLVELLLAHGANPHDKDKNNLTALDWSKVAHNDHIVNLLTSAMKTSKKGPLQFSEENSKKLALVLDEVKKASWRPTAQEKLAALVEQAKTLLLEGADPDTKGRQGVPVLIFAAWDSNIPAFNEIAKILIEHGADVNIKDDATHTTPLIWAAKLNQPDLVELLLEHGANPHVKDKNNLTALDWSKVGHNEHIVDLLKKSAAQ